jgi:hypothetical protein
VVQRHERVQHHGVEALALGEAGDLLNVGHRERVVSVHEAEAKLAAGPQQDVLLDLAGVQVVDSAGRIEPGFHLVAAVF